jgi:hypothetical protein
MEFSDKNKAARAASLAEFPARATHVRPKRYRSRRRRQPPQTFGQVLDNFEEDIRGSYRQGWNVDNIVLPFGPRAYRMLHIKRKTTVKVIKAKLERRGLHVTLVTYRGLELWFVVRT